MRAKHRLRSYLTPTLCITIFVISFWIGHTGSKIFKPNNTSTTRHSTITPLSPTEPISLVQNQKDSTQPFSLLFLGDMMFDRGVATNIKSKGEDFVFASSTRTLAEASDLVIANLEGPITTYKSKTIDATGKAIPGFTFTFPTSTAALLQRSGVDIVSLANNHTDNFGEDGLLQTTKYLKENGVDYFGNPTNDTSSNIASSSFTFCPPDKDHQSASTCIAFIGYHQFTQNNESQIIGQIKSLRSNPQIGFIVMFPHWGEEYSEYSNEYQRALAHTWIDAGANLIVGAHPHVVQTIEKYHDAFIFYSLGNYMFDQYFSYETTHGIALRITLSPTLNSINTVDIIPIDITRTHTREADKPDSDRIIGRLKEISPTVPELFYADHSLHHR